MRTSNHALQNRLRSCSLLTSWRWQQTPDPSEPPVGFHWSATFWGHWKLASESSSSRLVGMGTWKRIERRCNSSLLLQNVGYVLSIVYMRSGSTVWCNWDKEREWERKNESEWESEREKARLRDELTRSIFSSHPFHYFLKGGSNKVWIFGMLSQNFSKGLGSCLIKRVSLSMTFNSIQFLRFVGIASNHLGGPMIDRKSVV